MNITKQIKYGAIISYVSIAINILYGFLFTPWMVKTIGQNQYALYTLASSLIALFTVDFGLSAATSKFVSQYHAEGREDKVNQFLGTVYKLYFGVDMVILVIFAVVFFLIDTIYATLSPIELEQFKVVYIIAAATSTITFPFVTLNGVLNAYEKFVQLKVADLLYRFLLLILMSVVLLSGFGLNGVVTVNGIVAVLIIIYKLFVISKSTGIKVSFLNSDKESYRLIFNFSVWTTVATLANRLIFNITPSILGAVANTSAIAVFGIVTTIEGYVYLITSAINGMFMPRISKIYADKQEEKLLPLMIKVGRFQFALNGLIVVGFFVVGRQFVNLWMGPNYDDAYLGILLVIVPGLLYNSLQIANTAMTVRNKVHLSAIVALVAGVINVSLSLVLSKYFGVTGACISIFVAYMVRAILMIWLHDKKMNINIGQFIKACYLKMSVPIIVTAIAGSLLSKLFNQWNWISICVCGIGVIFIYSVSILLFGLDKEEKGYFNHLFNH